MKFADRLKHLIGRTESTPPPISKAMHMGKPSCARDVGLFDSVLEGWFNNATGEIFTGVPIGPNDIVVDVGCGEGGAIAFCGRQGAHVIAIDHDEESLHITRQRLRETTARQQECCVSLAEQLPVADGVATRVLCTEVLEHVDDPFVVMQELVRIGAPGSIYLLTVPDPVAEGVQQKLAPSSYFQKPNHVRIFSREAFAALASEVGLEITYQEYTGFYWSVWWSMFWACKVDFSDPQHPALEHWSKAWDELLHLPEGRRVQEALNAVMPKRQVIVARKPGKLE